MSWRDQYWAIQSNYFWNPAYSGYKSIDWRKLPVDDKGNVQVPKKELNPSGPIYTRKKRHPKLVSDLHRYEEILNHFFNITFAIAPDAMIERLFWSPFELKCGGPYSFASLERTCAELGKDFMLVCQHDALSLSHDACVAIEMKLGANSSIEQLLKYLILFAGLSKSRGDLSTFGLLFICPEAAPGSVMASCGVNENGRIPQDFVQRYKHRLKPDVRKEFEKHADRFESLLPHVSVKVMSWLALHAAVHDIRRWLNPRDPYQQTLARLCDGFLEQLEEHRDTGISQAEIEKAKSPFKDHYEIRNWADKLESDEPRTEADRRKSLVAYVCTTDWGGPSVLHQCQQSTTAELEDFVAALKDKTGMPPISMKFRWAADGDMPGMFSIAPF